jgi:hypothetical protein
VGINGATIWGLARKSPKSGEKVATKRRVSVALGNVFVALGNVFVALGNANNALLGEVLGKRGRPKRGEEKADTDGKKRPRRSRNLQKLGGFNPAPPSRFTTT